MKQAASTLPKFTEGHHLCLFQGGTVYLPSFPDMFHDLSFSSFSFFLKLSPTHYPLPDSPSLTA